MSDEQVAVDAVDSSEAVGSVESAVGTTDAGVAEVEPSPFQDGVFEWEADDGEKLSFTKKAELADFLRHSGMRKKDLEAEMGKVTQRSKYLEDQVKKYEALQRQAAESDGVKYDKFLRENPHIAQRLAEEMRGVKPTPNVDELLKERLEPYDQKFAELEKIEQARKDAEIRENAFQRLAQRYPDADRKRLDSFANKLSQVPEQDQQFAIMELLYHAVRGQESPAELERRMAQSADKRRPPSVHSTPGKTTSGGDDLTKMTPEQIREAAMADLAAQGTPK